MEQTVNELVKTISNDLQIVSFGLYVLQERLQRGQFIEGEDLVKLQESIQNIVWHPVFMERI